MYKWRHAQDGTNMAVKPKAMPEKKKSRINHLSVRSNEWRSGTFAGCAKKQQKLQTKKKKSPCDQQNHSSYKQDKTWVCVCLCVFLWAVHVACFVYTKPMVCITADDGWVTVNVCSPALLEAKLTSTNVIWETKERHNFTSDCSQDTVTSVKWLTSWFTVSVHSCCHATLHFIFQCLIESHMR